MTLSATGLRRLVEAGRVLFPVPVCEEHSHNVVMHLSKRKLMDLIKIGAVFAYGNTTKVRRIHIQKPRDEHRHKAGIWMLASLYQVQGLPVCGPAIHLFTDFRQPSHKRRGGAHGKVKVTVQNGTNQGTRVEVTSA